MTGWGRFLRHDVATDEPVPFGDRIVTVDFAGGPYELSGLDADQALHLHDRFGALCAPAGAPPACRILVARAEADAFEPDAGGPWKFELDLVHRPDRVDVAGLGLRGVVGLGPLTATLWLAPREAWHFSWAVHNFFRVVTAYRLLECGGALLHSAAFVHDGRAHLAFGPSGAGKTTISRLALERGGRVLSDDANALWRGAEGTLVRAVPFAGDLGQAPTRDEGWPLAALYRLEKAPVERLSPLPPGEAVAALLACAPFLNADRYRAETLLATLTRLLRERPAYRLSFSLSGEFWPLVTAAGEEP